MRRVGLNAVPPEVNAGGGGAYFRSSTVEFFSSGCALLDCVLGGGYATKRIINIVGDKSTGKTLLAIEAAANYAKQFPKADIWYAEVEAAFDRDYAARLGLPLERVKFIEDCTTVEDLFESLDERVKSKYGGLFILDSLDALSDRTEQASKVGEATYGMGKAKMMSQMFRRLVQKLVAAKISVLIVSQVRSRIGVTFGARYVRSGGRALDFYASQVLHLAQVGTLKRKIKGVTRPVGIDVKVKCTKSKVGPPFREARIPIIFFYGIDDCAGNLVWLDEVDCLGDYTSETARKALSNLRKLPPAEFAEERRRLAAAVVTAWEQIETQFLPPTLKYGDEK